MEFYGNNSATNDQFIYRFGGSIVSDEVDSVYDSTDSVDSKSFKDNRRSDALNSSHN